MALTKIHNSMLNSTVGTAANNIVALDSSARLPAVDGSQLSGVGKIRQVNHFILQDVASYTATSWTDTAIIGTITPTSSTSKILVMVSLHASTASNTGYFRITRNGTAVGVANAASSHTQASAGTAMSVGADQQQNICWFYLDSPATTSTVTYKVQEQSNNAIVVYLNRSTADSDSSNGPHLVSSITLIEVGA
jgi:hypothetical protein